MNDGDDFRESSKKMMTERVCLVDSLLQTRASKKAFMCPQMASLFRKADLDLETAFLKTNLIEQGVLMSPDW